MPHPAHRCRDRRELLPSLPWRCRLQHFGQHENAQADGLVSWSCCRCCPVFLKSIFSTAQQASPCVYPLQFQNSKLGKIRQQWQQTGICAGGWAEMLLPKCCRTLPMLPNSGVWCTKKGRGKPNSPPRPCHDAARVLPFCGRLRVVPRPAGAVAVHSLLANVVPARAAGGEYARYLGNGPS